MRWGCEEGGGDGEGRWWWVELLQGVASEIVMVSSTFGILSDLVSVEFCVRLRCVRLASFVESWVLFDGWADW